MLLKYTKMVKFWITNDIEYVFVSGLHDSRTNTFPQRKYLNNEKFSYTIIKNCEWSRGEILWPFDV